MSQSSINCQFCEVSSDIEWKCESCCLILCDNCNSKLHTKVKNLNEHAIVNIKDVDPETVLYQRVDLKSIPCTVHTNEKCFTYCRKCDQSLCTSCVIQPHQAEELVDVFNKKEKILSNLKLNIEETLPFFVEKAAEFRHVCTESALICNNIKEKILNRKTELQDSVLEEAERLLEQLDSIMGPTLDQIKAESDRLTSIEEDLKQRNDTLETALKTCAPSAIFATADKINQSLPDKTALEISLSKCSYESVPTAADIGPQLGFIFNLHELTLKHEFPINLPDISGIVALDDNNNVIYSVQNRIFRHFTISNSKFISTLENSLSYTSYIKDQKIDMTSHNGDIIISDPQFGNELKYYHKNGKLEKFDFDKSSIPYGVHSRNNEVIVGYENQGKVGVLTIDSKLKTIKRAFEFDKNSGERLLTYPAKILTNINDDICILDFESSKSKTGRVVVLGKWGQPKWTYDGHENINFDNKKFSPSDIATTKSGMIFVAETDTNAIHVLSMIGQFVRHFGVDDGIFDPISLNIDKNGQLMIGCKVISIIDSDGRETTTSKLIIAQLHEF